MVVGADGRAYLVAKNELMLWRPEGYGRRVAKPAGTEARVLTPRSIVRAIKRGYPVAMRFLTGS